MNSPWGLEWMILKETGWTRKYLLWGESWINIQMMLADAPSYKKVKTEQKGADLEDEDDFKEFLNLR
jgi:hypothetical protein